MPRLRHPLRLTLAALLLATIGLLHPFENPAAVQDGCAVNCTTSAPATAQANAPVDFTATSATTGCTIGPTFRWEFGDGTSSTQQSPQHSFLKAGTYHWRMTVNAGSGNLQTTINTIAGGGGDGNPATRASFAKLLAIARDPGGRGFYLAETPNSSDATSGSLIRFVNTSNASVTLAGLAIAPGSVRTLAGGGTQSGEGAPGLLTDLTTVTGLATSANGDLLYYIDALTPRVRALNVSNAPALVRGVLVAPGSVETLSASSLFGLELNGLAVGPDGSVYVADATFDINRVYRIAADGTTAAAVGNGAPTNDGDPFQPSTALNYPLLQPRDLTFDGNGNLFVADAGHARVIRVAPNGAVTLAVQLLQSRGGPYPGGIAVSNGNLYVADGTSQVIVRGNGGGVVAGQESVACEYGAHPSCGDGGPVADASFGMVGRIGAIPLTGIEGDANGIYLIDQTLFDRSRVRYLNFSGSAVTLGGVTIPAGRIQTIAGEGLTWPYDGGLATGAALKTPVGVAADANGNLFISDTANGRIRFVNRGSNPVTLFGGTPEEISVEPGEIVTINRDGGADFTIPVPARVANFQHPQGLTVTAQGVFVVDTKGGPFFPPGDSDSLTTSLLRFINTSNGEVTFYPAASSPIVVPPGHVATIAGGRDEGGASNGLFALDTIFIGASDVAVGPGGDLFLTDLDARAVRRINRLTGIVTNLALPPSLYTGLGMDATGRLLVADLGSGQVLRERAAGGGLFDVARSALAGPRDVAADGDGNLYVTLSGTHQIARIAPDGSVAVYAGIGPGFSGDGGPATDAQFEIDPPLVILGRGAADRLPQTVGITVAPGGEVIFTDSNNHRIRRIAPNLTSCVKTGTITINNVAPTLIELNPSAAVAGGAQFDLNVTGTNFVEGAIVRWNGMDRATTFVSSTLVRARILAADLATPGTANVTVFNPEPGGGASNALPFAVQARNPVPTVTRVIPEPIGVGRTDVVLTIQGTNFVSASMVRWNGTNRPTNFVSATQLTTQLLPFDTAVIADATLTVFNPPPDGGLSNAVTVRIRTPNPAPSLNALSRNFANKGEAPFTLTLTGTNFINNLSVVRWNEKDLETRWVDVTHLEAKVTAQELGQAGDYRITVFNPSPDGGLTAPLFFTVANPIENLSAASFAKVPLSSEMIVAAFGQGLAVETRQATDTDPTMPGIQLPTLLAGTSVQVRDQNGIERIAELLFVSPGQVNYIVPRQTANGLARIKIVSGSGLVSLAEVEVQNVSPGLFAANAEGAGVAAANALRVLAGSGAQVYEPVATFNPQTQRYDPLCIDLGSPAGNVYLVVYGTGFRRATNITARLGGVALPVLAVVPQGDYAGLDQINLGPIPATLVGAGPLDLTLTFDNQPANKVQICIR